MANIKSQKKRILTNEKARLRNNAYKSELKTLVRKVDEAVASSDKETAADALRIVSRKLDKAVSKGVLHKNNAANKKSGLAKRVAKI
ncbi:30S ribosomal protein S20 [Kocuria dechangensis]|uniref:Small ribosomal subunit protein bS20 n=1 Tax=Kocuria dechangensis TaxID=1176249 RepID=A0A917LUQ7_9MICC|nr:30S ribosomal protein S20 [Kocuria dechangensis]GGG59151.1 30S ribosomal protein S20 [Kocuria dechangensis]